MKKKSNFLTPLLLVGLFIIFTSGCKKDYVDNTGKYTDPRDGNVYKTIIIGDQEWMSENLKYLPQIVDPDSGSPTKPCYYVYGYDSADVINAKATAIYNAYGVLYNWPAAINACPSGWHLSSQPEWEELIYSAKFDLSQLKEIGTTHWASPNRGATNKIGFTALPGGHRVGDGTFNGIGVLGYWWTSTECDTSHAWDCGIFSNYSISSCYVEKERGFSVRCIRD